jgi:ribonucleoside-triphosphate reductase
MIRRIRVASNSPLIDVCRAHGYKVEPQRKYDGSIDRGTMVVEFPFSYPEHATTAAQVTALDQLEVVKRLQTEWSDNAVSCTVYYKKDELTAIQAYLKENYNTNFKSLSFLLHNEHGFDQAPYEEITEAHYNTLIAGTRLITSVNDDVYFDGEDECVSGMCPIK